MEQTILTADNNFFQLDEYIIQHGMKNILLVCGKSFDKLNLSNHLKEFANNTNIKISKFSDFRPNPDYNSVVKGVEVFRTNYCDSIIAVGGGSAMDVAKCIKLYANMPDNSNYLNQEIIQNNIQFIAVPTTAGTGSEATRFAVIYYKGEKQSVNYESCIPSAVLFDISVLNTLPEYQRKATMLDAFCHAVESFWSVNSTEESKEDSRKAIHLILTNYESYLTNNADGNANMLLAANYAGKAINVTQTTAGHAMCYKLTSLYGISHGHAAALCVCVLWRYMISNTKLCIDSRGSEYLEKTFSELAKVMGGRVASDGAEIFNSILNKLELSKPSANENDYDILKKSVNPVRLKNNPVQLDENTINYLYHEILG